MPSPIEINDNKTIRRTFAAIAVIETNGNRSLAGIRTGSTFAPSQ